MNSLWAWIWWDGSAFDSQSVSDALIEKTAEEAAPPPPTSSLTRNSWLMAAPEVKKVEIPKSYSVYVACLMSSMCCLEQQPLTEWSRPTNHCVGYI